MQIPTTALALSALTLPLALAQSKCYYPEGNEATDYNYIPCDGVNTTFSQCCLLEDGDRCLPNGLCYYGQRNYDYRAACSDKSWDSCSDACPGVLEDTWINVKACTTNEFCCNEDIDNGNCCEEGGDRFDLPAPSLTTSTSSSEASSTSTESEAASSTNDGGPNPQEPSPKAPNPQGESESSDGGGGGGGLSAGAQGAIGGSIGGVALIAIGIGAFWFLRKRKGKKGAAAAELGGGGGVESEKKGYWGGGGGGGQQQWHGQQPVEVEGSGTAVESGGREVPQRYELGG